MKLSSHMLLNIVFLIFAVMQINIGIVHGHWLGLISSVTIYSVSLLYLHFNGNKKCK